MTYQFGPYRLDVAARRLTRDAEPVAISDRHVAILHALVARAGAIVSKDQLIEAAWGDVAVGDNSLEQAISALRRTLGAPPDGTTYIETLARRGYRCSVPVTSLAARSSPEALDALLAPHRAFLDGRAALETLDRGEVARAVAIFEDVIRSAPDYAPAHLGLANALALRFEATRAESIPDLDALRRSVQHADEACRLAPGTGEAWAALGLACYQSRDLPRAIASAQRAVAIEPDNWRHLLRLAFVSWGEERLRASRHVLQLLPSFPFAHWLAATVHIARQSFVQADAELVAGAAAQDAHGAVARFGAVGLNLLLGLVRLRRGDRDAAIAAFDRELALGREAHIYAREARANTWCAHAGVRLHQGDAAGALTALDEAAASLPGHAIATAAAAALRGGDTAAQAAFNSRVSQLQAYGAHFDAAYVSAVHQQLGGRTDRAAELLAAAIAVAPPGSAGWGIPVDPLLRVHLDAVRWQPTLATLRARAF